MFFVLLTLRQNDLFCYSSEVKEKWYQQLSVSDYFIELHQQTMEKDMENIFKSKAYTKTSPKRYILHVH